MTFKTFTPYDFKLDEAGAITLAFCQLNVVDSDADVSLPGSFPSGKAVPMSAYGHTSWDGALPPGKGAIREAGEWAVFEGQFLMETDHGRNTYHTVKALAELQEWSYGLKVVDHSFGTQDGKSVRYIRKQDVWEVSPVLKGAGVRTHTMAMKGGAPGPDAPYAEHLSWYADGLPALLDRIKDRADFRASEGRKLSRTDRARLEDIEAALTGHVETIRALLVVPEDPKSAAERQRAIHTLIGEAAALGVAV